MSNKIKNILWGIFAVVIVVVGVVWFVSSDLEHIEDTNGPDNFELQSITDQNIINQDMGMIGGISVKDDWIGDGVTISADKFTGVYEILYDNYILPSDFYLQLTALTVTEGNFKAAIVHDGKIVDVLEFNSDDPFTDYLLEDVSGLVQFVVAGESASFSFSMVRSDYDSFSHT